MGKYDFSILASCRILGGAESTAAGACLVKRTLCGNPQAWLAPVAEDRRPRGSVRSTVAFWEVVPRRTRKMQSPGSDTHDVGALDSMEEKEPSAPSGAGPQSPSGEHSIDALAMQDPAPWPLPVSPRKDSENQKPPSSATQKKLFNFPETPGTGACFVPSSVS